MFVNFVERDDDDAPQAARSASPKSAAAFETRSRRGTSSSARGSSSRWRSSTSSRRTMPTSGSNTGARAHRVVPAVRHPRAICCDSARTTRKISPTTRRRPGTSSSSSRGVGASSKGSPTAPTSTSLRTPSIPAFASSTSTNTSGERYTPYVIEPAAGATRTMMAFLLAAYDEDEVGGEHRAGAAARIRGSRPSRSSVLPLSRKEPLSELARDSSPQRDEAGSTASTTTPSRSVAAIGDRTRSARPSA